MNRWQWYLARGFSCINHAAITVAFLAGLVVVLMTTGIKPREILLEQSKARLQQQAQELERLQKIASQRPSINTDTLQLPPVSQLNTMLLRLHAHARDAGMPLTAATYKLEPQGSRHWRYTVSVEGNIAYPIVRRFVATTLQKHRNAAIDKLEIRRDNVLNGQPGVHLQLSLYFSTISTSDAS